MLTKEQILGVKDLIIREVEMPEWGGSVYVRGLTGSERDAFEASVIEQRGKTNRVNMINVRAKLLVLTICDKDGNPCLFYTSPSPRDRTRSRMPSSA